MSVGHAVQPGWTGSSGFTWVGHDPSSCVFRILIGILSTCLEGVGRVPCSGPNFPNLVPNLRRHDEVAQTGRFFVSFPFFSLWHIEVKNLYDTSTPILFCTAFSARCHQRPDVVADRSQRWDLHEIEHVLTTRSELFRIPPVCAWIRLSIRLMSLGTCVVCLGYSVDVRLRMIEVA